MSKSLIVIPTYNEVLNIQDIITAVLSQNDSFDILVVDDNSPDGTAQAVKDLDAYNHRVFLLQRKGKLGLGTAYLAGFQYGIEQQYQTIFEMDADFSHPPEALNRMVAQINNGYDVVIGSRYISGGGLENWPTNRKLLSKMASYYVKFWTWMPVNDPTAGFICYKREVLESIDFDKITFKGYAFQIEMKYAAFTKGYKIKEIPIIFKDREKGESKLNSSIISEAIKGVVTMRLFRGKKYYSKN